VSTVVSSTTTLMTLRQSWASCRLYYLSFSTTGISYDASTRAKIASTFLCAHLCIMFAFHPGVSLNQWSVSSLLCGVSFSHLRSKTRSHLEYLYLQVLSIVTVSQLRRIFERRTNFDLGRLLGGGHDFCLTFHLRDSFSKRIGNPRSVVTGKSGE